MEVTLHTDTIDHTADFQNFHPCKLWQLDISVSPPEKLLCVSLAYDLKSNRGASIRGSQSHVPGPWLKGGWESNFCLIVTTSSLLFYF